MIDMNTVTDEQADYMNTPMEAVEEIDMLWDKLSAFFPELGGYIETDFCERTARRMVWDIEKGFALVRHLRAFVKQIQKNFYVLGQTSVIQGRTTVFVNYVHVAAQVFNQPA